MSKELIERLREQVLSYDEWAQEKCLEAEAADRIEELEREIERKMSAAAFVLKERDALQADRARLRGKLAYAELILSKEYNHVVPSIVKALATTPEQSLARHNNRIKEA